MHCHLILRGALLSALLLTACSRDTEPKELTPPSPDLLGPPTDSLSSPPRRVPLKAPTSVALPDEVSGKSETHEHVRKDPSRVPATGREIVDEVPEVLSKQEAPQPGPGKTDYHGYKGLPRFKRRGCHHWIERMKAGDREAVAALQWFGLDRDAVLAAVISGVRHSRSREIALRVLQSDPSRAVSAARHLVRRAATERSDNLRDVVVDKTHRALGRMVKEFDRFFVPLGGAPGRGGRLLEPPLDDASAALAILDALPSEALSSSGATEPALSAYAEICASGFVAPALKGTLRIGPCSPIARSVFVRALASGSKLAEAVLKGIDEHDVPVNELADAIVNAMKVHPELFVPTCQVLLRSRKLSQEAVRYLADGVDDGDVIVAWWSAFVLASHGFGGGEIADTLLAGLDRESLARRLVANDDVLWKLIRETMSDPPPMIASPDPVGEYIEGRRSRFLERVAEGVLPRSVVAAFAETVMTRAGDVSAREAGVMASATVDALCVYLDEKSLAIHHAEPMDLLKPLMDLSLEFIRRDASRMTSDGVWMLMRRVARLVHVRCRSEEAQKRFWGRDGARLKEMAERRAWQAAVFVLEFLAACDPALFGNKVPPLVDWPADKTWFADRSWGAVTKAREKLKRKIASAKGFVLERWLGSHRIAGREFGVEVYASCSQVTGELRGYALICGGTSENVSWGTAEVLGQRTGSSMEFRVVRVLSERSFMLSSASYKGRIEGSRALGEYRERWGHRGTWALDLDRRQNLKKWEGTTPDAFYAALGEPSIRQEEWLGTGRMWAGDVRGLPLKFKFRSCQRAGGRLVGLLRFSDETRFGEVVATGSVRGSRVEFTTGKLLKGVGISGVRYEGTMTGRKATGNFQGPGTSGSWAFERQ